MPESKKICNPFNNITDYHCFGCASENLQGLQMEFYEEGEEIVSVWEPKSCFCGYNDLLHGGIQATLCDELASWVVYVKCECSGVTSRLNMKYRKPVMINKGFLKLKGKISEIRRNTIAVINVNLYDGSDELCAQAEAMFWLFSEEESVAHYGYPSKGVEEFRIKN